MDSEKGLVILYTGEGKGKTTAALGLVLRAVGYKRKCLIIQFGKMWFTGELAGVKKLSPYVKFIQGGKGFVKILGDKLPLAEHKKAALDTFDVLKREVLSDKWDVVVADEIVGAVFSGLLSLTKLLQLIKHKSYRLDLVLTGHHASEKLIEEADLVTEMKEIKHPFQKGILAKKGIDF
ncbi:cob(I)yrinic acid a,c-diamide adenosyltransferase [Candidatus Daviesbacteria bacterium RIFCSPLOWO2_02_FULL_36_7]|uniref:Cob(I)yrinic acid a,c-diamide adenosyltransferase n=1 Tax=Candidatus Daviesbacteria bacterium RIFCSPLOWO2_02_FULL_36_7 TaxID=1797792 RepID=A0A1F5MI13_9BACT|nr:MAG: cob(I)yrinic acid a,c-diamide adenosyltransferase [Candidatus Daviesbacteria bacterium RIFCSPLOWO2_02_FULL_36_7]